MAMLTFVVSNCCFAYFFFSSSLLPFLLFFLFLSSPLRHFPPTTTTTSTTMVNHHSHQPHETDALLDRAEAGVTRVRYEARSKWSGIRHKVFFLQFPSFEARLTFKNNEQGHNRSA